MYYRSFRLSCMFAVFSTERQIQDRLLLRSLVSLQESAQQLWRCGHRKETPKIMSKYLYTNYNNYKKKITFLTLFLIFGWTGVQIPSPAPTWSTASPGLTPRAWAWSPSTPRRTLSEVRRATTFVSFFFLLDSFLVLWNEAKIQYKCWKFLVLCYNDKFNVELALGTDSNVELAFHRFECLRKYFCAFLNVWYPTWNYTRYYLHDHHISSDGWKGLRLGVLTALWGASKNLIKYRHITTKNELAFSRKN